MIQRIRNIYVHRFRVFGFLLLILPNIVWAGHPVTIDKFTNQPTIRAWIYLSNEPAYNEYFTQLEYPEKTQQRLAKMGTLAKKTASDLVPGEELRAIIDSNVICLRHYSRILRAFSAEINQSNFEILTSLPIVAKIEMVESYITQPPDLNEEAAGTITKSARVSGVAAYENQLKQLNILKAQDSLGLTGKGVRIGFIDTGFFKDHEVFSEILSSGRLIAEYDFINDDNNVSDEEVADTARNSRQS
ncbi:MAG TPA: hypothetical protein PKV46_02040, partial [Candidatus Marinimicrobia bacterium]|nr:hypothetical protein [Candidatus Neomarinimicrobiota bacterium]